MVEWSRSIQTEAERSACSKSSIGAMAALGTRSSKAEPLPRALTGLCKLTLKLRSSQPNNSSTWSRGMGNSWASWDALGTMPLACKKRALAALKRVSCSFTLVGIRMARLWVERARFNP